MSKAPILKEVAKGDEKALRTLIKKLPDIHKAYQKAKIGGHCRAYGGRVGLKDEIGRAHV